MVTRLQKERAKQQISQARQIQKPTTKRVPFIPRKQRVVTQIAEKEAAKKQQVKSELESSGISKATTVQEYQASYEKLSPEVKRYVQTPEQVGQNVEQAKQELIQSNQALIDEKIKYYQDKKQKKHDYYRKKSKKYKEKGDSERAQRYEDKLDEYEAQYEGIIEKLQKNRNLYASFDDILRYAKEWGQYERDKEEARNENQKTKYTPPKTVEEMHQRGLEYLKKHPESFGGTAPEMVKAIEAGADIYKPLPTTKYKMYDKPISAYYDPRTGREVLQSIAPEIAKQQGLLPIEIKGVQKETGKYLVESKTGLLTSQQQAIREFYSKIKPELARELPTTFEIGVAPGKPDIMQIFEPSKSAYEIAAVSKPYSKKELAVMEYKKSPEEFIKKYGYMPTETGEIGAVAGGIVPVEAMDIASIVAGGKAVISAGGAIRALAVGGEKAAAAKTLAVAGGWLLSTPVTSAAEKVRSLIPGSSPVSQVLRGGVLAASAVIPAVSEAYISELAKSAIEDPIGTAKGIKDYITTQPYEAATVAAIGAGEVRVRQRVARSKLYYDIADRLETQYGTKSVEVVDFKKAWNRAFKELPKRADIIQKWTSKDLEVVAGDKKLIKILDEINSEYKPEIIGSTTIAPQTTLKELPRGKAGDIDVQNVPGLLRNKSKKMAYEIYNRLRREGYNVKINEGTFHGTPKYYLTLNGKELINIGTSTNYFLKTQLGPLRDLFEFEKVGQFATDPLTGVRLSGIRGQLRVKIAKGYGGDISRIRKLKQLMKENKLQGREKDIIDALGIVRGTEYLFEGKKYIGPKYRVGAAELVSVAKETVSGAIKGKIAKIDDILTGKKMPTKEYGYYEKIPAKKRKATYYEKPAYDMQSYMLPTYRPPKITVKKYAKPQKYKRKAPEISNYLVPKKETGKVAKYREPQKYEKQILPQDYLVPMITRKPARPPYKPTPTPKPKIRPTSLMIPKKKKLKKIQKKKPKKKIEKKVLPTLTQQILGIKGKKAIKRPTGFEAVRII